MYYQDSVVEDVRSANNIVDVISSYVRLQKKGNSYFGLCPFHNEKTASFSVSEEKQMYYCFGCGAGGNVFTFLMEYENFTFSEALKYLAERAGISLPEEEDSSRARAEADKKQKILSIYREAGKYYYAALFSERGKNALSYLEGRGLTRDTITRFGLGYSDKYSDSLYRYMKNLGYADELLVESGLFSADEKHGVSDKFWNRVMFPILDMHSRVIAFGGRVMGDAKPKYLNSPETLIFDKSRNLYGLHAARKAKGRRLILCEGYMDVIAMHQAGFTEAVASLGTSFTDGQAQLIRRFADSVYLVYDSDDAGVRAILRALPILRRYGIDALVVDLSPYKDPDEFIKGLGRDAFSERLRKAENGFLFRIKVLERDYDLNRPEQKTRFLHQIAKELLVFPEEIERNTYIQAIANRYFLQSQDLHTLVANAALVGTPPRQTEDPDTPRTRASARQGKTDKSLEEAQKIILTWLTEEPALYDIARKYLEPDDFTEGLFRQAATDCYRQMEEGEVIPASIISSFTEEDEQKTVASFFSARITRDGEKDRLREVKECLLRIKRASIGRKNEELDPSDLAALQKLILSKKALEKLEKVEIVF